MGNCARADGAGWSCLAPLAGTLPWLLLAACEVGKPLPPRPTAGDRYEQCSDPLGTAAMGQARAHLARGDYAAALPELERAITACPDYLRAHLAYADAAERVGGDAAAAMRARYAEPEAEGASSPVRLYLRARLSHDDEFTREQLLLEAVARDRGFYWAYLSLARLHRSGDRTAKALDYLNSALSVRPGFAEARLELAEIYEGLGRYEEAEAEYANYLRAQPTDREVERAYVRLLIYRLRRADDVYRICERQLQEDPGDIEVLMNLAAIHWIADKPAQAAARYRQVLKLDPTRARAVLNLGNLYYDYWRGLAPEGSDDAAGKRSSWTRARAAYRYYLGMSRTEGMFDFGDYHLGVPYRLAKIEELLGAAPAAVPTLDSLD